VVRSIIDINASFKGISNLEVATTLASYVQKNADDFNKPQALKYILYFNDANELCALPIQDYMANQEPIILGSSDKEVIKSRLNCSPDQCFTYYDQSHTVGTDIKQGPNSKGLVLIDQNTHFQSFLQGSMRMRDLLEGNQTIDIIVPKKLAKTSFDQLSSMMVTNQENELQKENFNAAKAKMINCVRTDFIKRLLSISGK
jgi:hypothetical protein